MKKFKGTKARNVVIVEAEAKGWTVDTSKYDAGSDWTTIHISFPAPQEGEEPITGSLIWASWNGHFTGTLSTGVSFDHSSGCFDEEPWYSTLLDLFYETEEVPA